MKFFGGESGRAVGYCDKGEGGVFDFPCGEDLAFSVVLLYSGGACKTKPRGLIFA